MEEPKFIRPNTKTIADHIRALPVAGRLFKPPKPMSCRVCRRRIEPLGRLPYPSYPTCQATLCQLTPLSAATRLFPTPYGCAVHVDILGVFGRVADVEERIFLQRQPIVERADVLAQAYVDLIHWQETFDHYERLSNPSGYAEGRVSVVPPRRIDEVLALRAVEQPEPIDPTRRYSREVARTLQRIFKKGPEGFELPF